MAKYVSKMPDKNGLIDWTEVENQTWQTLYERQLKILPQYACPEFIAGIEQLNMSPDHVPQLGEVNDAMRELTGWSVVPVPAMITPTQFFTLLTNKQFPAATFIRTPEEIDYLEEPDIFHELFGHCPMIAHQGFADFLQKYGEMALKSEHHTLLARLFWFTVEFGLINTKDGLRCFGGGILSSFAETQYAIDSELPVRKPFDLLEILRTPYRVDQIQGTYFVFDDFAQLNEVLEQDLDALIEKAKSLGELELVEIDKGADKDEWITC